MPKYIVSTMIQSANVDNNEPVQVRWYTGDSLAQAIAAMTSAAAHHEEVTENTGIPASARYSTLGVTLSIEQESATPSTVRAFDTEDPDYSLSDCYLWYESTSTYPEWASGDCTGPRVGKIDSPTDKVWHDFVMCEKHFNQLP